MVAERRLEGTLEFMWFPHTGKLVLVFLAGCPAFALVGSAGEKEVKERFKRALATVEAVSICAKDNESECWRVEWLIDVDNLLVAAPLEVELDDYRGTCAVMFKAEHTVHAGMEEKKMWFPFDSERWSPEKMVVQFTDGNVWELT